MVRAALIAMVPALAAFPAPAPSETTPDGPATLTTTHVETAPAMGAVAWPRVAVALRVTVGPGGRGGNVRPRIGAAVGDPVELPAVPGTYTLPAPHVPPSGAAGIVQTTGAHAIVTREACRPTAERAVDPCETKWVDVQRAGQPDLRDRGA